MTAELPARLPCGADLDELLEQAADDPGVLRTAHQQTCVHCQAALAEFEQLLAPLRSLAAESVRPPPHLLEEVLRRIRSAVANPSWALLQNREHRHGSGRGVTRVAADVVVEVARVAANTVAGVRVALTAHDRGVQVGASGSTVAVRVTVAADYGEDLHDLGRRIHRSVGREVSELVGVDVATVTVHIDDVLDR